MTGLCCGDKLVLNSAFHIGDWHLSNRDVRHAQKNCSELKFEMLPDENKPVFCQPFLKVLTPEWLRVLFSENLPGAQTSSVKKQHINTTNWPSDLVTFDPSICFQCPVHINPSVTSVPPQLSYLKFIFLSFYIYQLPAGIITRQAYVTETTRKCVCVSVYVIM